MFNHFPLEISFCSHETNFNFSKYVTPEAIQHSGENVLNLLKSLSNAEELPFPDKSSQYVFFDFLGWRMYVYSKEVGIAINTIISILAVSASFANQIKKKSIFHILKLILEHFVGLVMILAGVAASLLVCLLLALFFQLVGRTMTWNNNYILAITTYGSVSLIFSALVYMSLFKLGLKYIKIFEEEEKVQIHLSSVNIIFAIVTLTVSYIGFLSGYMTMVILFFSLFVNLFLLLPRIIKMKKTKKNKELEEIQEPLIPQEESSKSKSSKMKYFPKIHYWLVVLVVGQIPIILWTTYIYHISMDLLIPIVSNQINLNPDIIIGLVTALFTLATCAYFVSKISYWKLKLETILSSICRFL